MKFTLNPEAVFRNVLYAYDAISPALILADFERAAGNPLERAHIPTGQKKELTFEMLVAFNTTGHPKLHLSGMERHSLAVPVTMVRNLLDEPEYPSPTRLEKRIASLVDYKNTSGGRPFNALTYYLCAKALQYVGLQTGEGAGDVDLSPLEIALGIKPPAP